MNTDVKRFYAVLGVDPTAPEETIRRAFRQRAKELHPDAQSGNAGAFILLKRAYDTLLDPELRAAYDRACQPPPRPRPSPVPPRRPQAYRPMPPLPRPRTSRGGGVGFVRYAIAFIIMAALSLGGIQAMISLTEAPSPVQTRSVVANVDATPAPAAEPSAAPGSTKSGFWDATPAAGKKSP